MNEKEEIPLDEEFPVITKYFELRKEIFAINDSDLISKIMEIFNLLFHAIYENEAFHESGDFKE